MDVVFYWVGAVVSLVGLVGAGAFLALWALDYVTKLTKTVAIIAEWYVRVKLGIGKDPRDQEIADLKDSNARLADVLAAAKVRAGDTW